MVQSSGREPPPPGSEHASHSHEEQVETARNNEASNFTSDVCTDGIASVEKTAIVKNSASPFTAGYGDFCFRRNEDDLWIHGDQLQRRTMGSNDTRVEEIGSFKRAGCFYFERLPLEIRHEILRLILAPFFHRDHETQKLYTLIDISHLPDFDDKHNLTFHEFLKKRMPPSRIYYPGIVVPSTMSHGRVGPIQKTYKEEKVLFERVGNFLIKNAKPHPGRNGKYRLALHTKINDKVVDYILLEWVRKLSHVSRSFRNELGDVFWRRSYISTTLSAHPRGPRFEDLHDFLKDRMAVCSGISKLIISMNENTNAWPYVRTSAIESVKRRFKFFAENLRLDTLKLSLIVYEEDLEDLLAAKGKFATATATRQLVVARKFDLSVYFEHDDANFEKWISETWEYSPWYDEMNPEDEFELQTYEYQDMLHDKYVPMIRDLMLPNTLREKLQS
ncbi:hypothetical protein HYFRA_00006643 [Hymenoscyphus fraxineus]|uniref:Uncharacterized protein n=1 Tax=Hymenoscyphus fraxineus TaxID=746836 RepID=A0A9N9PST2_9HELO|nr:hypothetical protein HYFRA_00006643 [Hymenoscyphus fraxineus]